MRRATLLVLAITCFAAACAPRTIAGDAEPARAAATPPADTTRYTYRPPAALDDGLPAASVQDIGLATGPLEEMTRLIRRGRPYRNIHSVLIAKDGRLVYEEYFAGEDVRRGVGALGHVVFSRDTRHDVRSITKSVVSALLGIAAERQRLSIDTPVLDLFPEHADLRTTERNAIRLRHMLDMTAGLEWNERISYADTMNDEIRMNRAPDPVRFVLEKPVVATPGTVWEYSGGTTQLLAEVVQRVSGQPLLAFAREALFEPLGIADWEWITDRGQPMPSAASGLRLRPRDMAKFGMLYMQQGRWNGQQIIPVRWVETSLQRALGLAPDSVRLLGDARFEEGYAHQWWHTRLTMPGGSFTVHAAVGNGGQRIFIVPELRLLAVFTAGTYNQGADSPRLFFERVLPWAAGLPEPFFFPPPRPPED